MYTRIYKLDYYEFEGSEIVKSILLEWKVTQLMSLSLTASISSDKEEAG